MGNKYVIVLTACINPGKMIHTSLTDVDIRRRQYEDALEFYLLQTDYPIVFVENSGTDISGDFRKFVDCGRLEFVTFQGNEEFDRKKGKGYGEALILEYALEHSLFVYMKVKVAKQISSLVIGFNLYSSWGYPLARTDYNDSQNLTTLSPGIYELKFVILPYTLSVGGYHIVFYIAERNVKRYTT